MDVALPLLALATMGCLPLTEGMVDKLADTPERPGSLLTTRSETYMSLKYSLSIINFILKQYLTNHIIPTESAFIFYVDL